MRQEWLARLYGGGGVYLVGDTELAAIGSVSDVSDVPIAVGDSLGQIENVVLYLGQTLFHFAGHITVGIPSVLHLLIEDTTRT